MRDKMPGKQLQSHCGLARLVIWEGGMVGRCREFFTLRPSILGKDSCSCCHSIAPTLVQLKLHEMWYILGGGSPMNPGLNFHERVLLQGRMIVFRTVYSLAVFVWIELPCTYLQAVPGAHSICGCVAGCEDQIPQPTIETRIRLVLLNVLHD